MADPKADTPVDSEAADQKENGHFRVVQMSDTPTNASLPQWCVASGETTGPKGERDAIAFFHDEAAARWFAEHFSGMRPTVSVRAELARIKVSAREKPAVQP